MIKISVMNEEDQWHKWWENFSKYYSDQGVDMTNTKEITRTLAEWNAIDTDPTSKFFYFENERDHVAFMLRWL